MYEGLTVFVNIVTLVQSWTLIQETEHKKSTILAEWMVI